MTTIPARHPVRTVLWVACVLVFAVLGCIGSDEAGAPAGAGTSLDGSIGRADGATDGSRDGTVNDRPDGPPVDAGDVPDGGGELDSGADAHGGPPTVVSTIPGKDAVDVDVSGTVAIQFSEPMNPGSVTVTAAPAAPLSASSWDSSNTTVTFTLTAALAYATTYTVTINGEDAQGQALAATSFAFTTRSNVVDTTPPTITWSAPLDGATGVSAAAPLGIVFSEPMASGTVAVVVTPSIDVGLATWSDSNRRVDFLAPPEAWPASTSVVVTVSGQDVAGNLLAGKVTIGFTTAAIPDTTPPTVQSTAPGNGAGSVAIGAAVSVSFSEPIDAATVSATSLTLTTTAGAGVSGSFAWDPTGTLVTFDPTVDLAPATGYVVTLSTAVRDRAGNSLGAPYTFGFTTGVAPDTTAPTVTMVTPATGAIGVAQKPSISVTFSEPMDKASAQAAFSVTSPAGVISSKPTWSASGLVMTVPIATLLPHGSQITWQISTGAKDLAGNPMAQTFSATFRVLRLITRRGIYPTLDGYIVEDQTVWLTGSQFEVGDTSSNRAYRGFLTFDLSNLPESLVRITAATFSIHQAGATSGVYTALGPLFLESVDFGAGLGLADFDTPTLRYRKCTGSVCVTQDLRATLATEPTTHMEADQLDKITDDWENRASRGHRAEFRIRFNKKTDGADNFTRVHLYSSEETSPSQRPELEVTYEIP
jgi:hypothetical protein